LRINTLAQPIDYQYFTDFPDFLVSPVPVTYSLGVILLVILYSVDINYKLSILISRLRKRLHRTVSAADRHKKRIPYIGYPLYNLLTSKDYLVAIVSTTAGAAVVSAFTTAESTATTVESVVASVEAFPPHATNVVAIAKIAITFFILFVLLFKFKYTLIDITLYTKYKVIGFLYSKGTG
jgi:hypothetical protein